MSLHKGSTLVCVMACVLIPRFATNPPTNPDPLCIEIPTYSSDPPLQPPPDVTKFDADAVQMYLDGLYAKNREYDSTIQTLRTQLDTANATIAILKNELAACNDSNKHLREQELKQRQLPSKNASEPATVPDLPTITVPVTARQLAITGEKYDQKHVSINQVRISGLSSISRYPKFAADPAYRSALSNGAFQGIAYDSARDTVVLYFVKSSFAEVAASFKWENPIDVEGRAVLMETGECGVMVHKVILDGKEYLLKPSKRETE